MTLKEFPINKVFQLFEPGPVIWLVTSGENRPNVMTMTWHLVMDFVPPIIGCVVSSGNVSFRTLRKTRECVLAIPTANMAAKAVDAGNCSGAGVDKFKRFGLTPLLASEVKVPLVQECLYNVECHVVDDRQAAQYNFFILKGLKAWVDPRHKDRRFFHAVGDGTFTVDGRTLNLKKRMVKFPEVI